MVEGAETIRFLQANISSVMATTQHRVSVTELPELMGEVGKDMKALHTGNSTPQITSAQPSSPATMYLGVRTDRDLPLPITIVAPPNPPKEFDASSVSGSLGNLTSKYLSLPLPEGNAASNVHLSLMISQLISKELTWRKKTTSRTYPKKKDRLLLLSLCLCKVTFSTLLSARNLG